MDLTEGKQQARQASNSVWLERLVRLGLVAYGVVHLLVAWLALQLAFGDHSGAANQQGALHALARQPFGRTLLWVVAIGLFALAVWQATEVFWGHTREESPKREFKRLGSAGKVVVYAAIGATAVKIALGEGSGSSGQALTERLMSQTLGRLLVGLVGVVIIVVAVVQIKRGVTTSFTKDLASQATSGPSGTAVVRVGQIGYVAKGIAFVVLGGLFVYAAWTYQANKTGSLDVALSTLLQAGVGPWLLVLVALGIGCFGLYCFGWARYADTTT
jgi:uncharacterized protein DUF1206